MGTSLLASTGAVSCYPVLMVKNQVPSWQILKFYSCSHKKKTCKAITFMCLWGQLDFHMFEQKQCT